MTIYFSDTINNLERGHAHFEFVDIKMHSDTRLFIDPSLIKVLKDAWCKEANRVIDSYFDALYEAYRSCDEARINRLLSFAQEIRNTHLGYGRTIQGHGNTADGLAEKLSCLGARVPCNVISHVGVCESLVALLGVILLYAAGYDLIIRVVSANILEHLILGVPYVGR